jgi:Leucine-rich repeat (LRR) protein
MVDETENVEFIRQRSQEGVGPTDAAAPSSKKTTMSSKKMSVIKGGQAGAPVNQKPKCFDTMMARANHATSKRDRDKSKSLSGRFLSNLFMPTVDAELVGEFLESFDMQKYADEFDHKAIGPEDNDDSNDSSMGVEVGGGEHSTVVEFLKLDCTGKDITRGDKKKSEIPLNYLNKYTRLSNPLSVMGDSNSHAEFPAVASGSVTNNYISGITRETTNTHNARSFDDNISAITGDADETEAFVNISDEDSYVTLPSIHSGVQMKVPSDQAERYFGKKARGDFFEKYRNMSNTRTSFARPVMTRNTDEVWENAALLSEEEKRERARRYRLQYGAGTGVGAESESGRRSPMRSRSPSPINVLLSGRAPKGDLTTGTYTSSPGNSPDDNSSHPSSAAGPPDSSNVNWATDVAIFNSAVEELDHEFLADASLSKLRGRYTGGSPGPGGQYHESMEEDDELSAITGHDDRSTVSLVHSRLKGSMHLPSLNLALAPSSSHSLGGPSGEQGQEDGATDILSPRQQYLAACIDRGLAPLPSLVMRNNFTTKIDLTHFGIGDAMGCAFAECLHKLPSIESLNLCDNSLTDESLYPILRAVMKISGLQELDLSRNKIDEMASEALAEYLSNPACPLYKLVLISADVDDGECAAMVECLESNRNLRELDLSNNLLGSAETIPGAATGGAALADFIMTEGVPAKVTQPRMEHHPRQQRRAVLWSSREKTALSPTWTSPTTD